MQMNHRCKWVKGGVRVSCQPGPKHAADNTTTRINNHPITARVLTSNKDAGRSGVSYSSSQCPAMYAAYCWAQDR
jgi:hypothetical protein